MQAQPNNQQQPETNEQDQTLNDLNNREMEVMEISLVAKASKTAITVQQYIQTRLKMGTEPSVIEQSLLDDLNNGGRIFGEFRNAIRATTKGVINRTRDNSIFSDFGITTPYRWIAVLINSCPDCIGRHNNVKTWAEWESEGLPRTGATVCLENCQCMLLPSANTQIEPIIRSKK